MTTSTVRTTGVGSWPGTDLAEALKITFAECPDLPYLPELPDRGAPSALVGRGAALLSGLCVDLQLSGWRLTDGSSREHRLAQATLRDDLDQLEEAAQGYAGELKLSVAGPWTLGALIERPRGDKVLGDPGARRDLGQSLAHGVAEFAQECATRFPEVSLTMQLDEPLLPQVLSGGVRTASGLARHRTISEEEASGAIAAVVSPLKPLGVSVVVHCCAPDFPISLMHAAGVHAVSVDLDQLRTRDWDGLGMAMENGVGLWAGAHPTGGRLSADQVADRVVSPVRRLGLDPAVTTRMVLTPACGLANLDSKAGIAILRTLASAATIVTEQLQE